MFKSQLQYHFPISQDQDLTIITLVLSINCRCFSLLFQLQPWQWEAIVRANKKYKNIIQTDVRIGDTRLKKPICNSLPLKYIGYIS